MAGSEWKNVQKETGNFGVQPFVMSWNGGLPDIAREPCDGEEIGLDILVYLIV